MTAVIFTLLPVFAVVLAGWGVARAKLINAEGVAGFGNVTFYLFVPALLFRAMRNIHFETLDPRPMYTYFGGALLCFFIVIFVSRQWLRRDIRHGVVTALGVTWLLDARDLSTLEDRTDSRSRGKPCRTANWRDRPSA